MRSAEPWSSAPLMSASVGLDRVKTKADPIALTIGHFYERAAAEWLWDVYSDCAGDVARNVARLLYGQHIVGAVPSFDASFPSEVHAHEWGSTDYVALPPDRRRGVDRRETGHSRALEE